MKRIDKLTPDQDALLPQQAWDQVRDQVWDQVRAQVGEQVRDQVGAQVRDQVWDQVRATDAADFFPALPTLRATR